jgi:DNA-binding NtrC family response regulator
VPPLDSHREDIPLLVAHFLRNNRGRCSSPPVRSRR